MMSIRENLIYLCLLCAVLTTTAEEKSRLFGGARFTSTYFDTADIKGTDASFAQSNTDLSLRYLFLEFGWRETHYMWQNSESLPFGNGDDPWNDLRRVSLGLGWRGKVFDDWTLMIMTGVFAGFEEELEDAGGWYVRAFASRQLGEDFTLRLGLIASVNERIDEYDAFLPMVGFGWRKRTDEGLSASFGFPFTGVQYRFNPKFAVDAGLMWAKGSPYRLADDSHVEPGGFMASEGYGGEIGLSWNPTKIWGLRFAVGMVGERELLIFDDRGKEVLAYEVDSTPACKFELSGRF